MYNTNKIINNLAQFAANYTQDLATPFEENAGENSEAETPILIIADICKLLGLSENQTYRVLGRTGTEFLEYLNSPLDISYILSSRAKATGDNPETVNAFGMLIPIVGTVSDGGTITLNDYGRSILQ